VTQRLSEAATAAPAPALPRAARLAIAAVTGLAVGALTSVLQKYLNQPWLSLVNSASPWLAPVFALGALWRRPPAAALAGLGTGLLELAGYYLTAAARGYPAGGAILVFWTICAVIGGPVFGVAGWLWWRGSRRWSALGAAVLPAAFGAEAAVVYAWSLHYYSSAVLLAVLGAVALAVTGWHRRQYPRAAGWLVVTFAAGVAAELVLHLVYRQSR
jgi:Family of unknown function (DUF6518)